jgi:hypothetical protein
VSLCVVCATSCRHTKPDAAAPVEPSVRAVEAAMAAAPVEQPQKVDFTTQVQPILEARCQPCHFIGGVMYERRPFDRPETIHDLGEKLFTRLKEQDEQRVIREFLAQGQH